MSVGDIVRSSRSDRAAVPLAARARRVTGADRFPASLPSRHCVAGLPDVRSSSARAKQAISAAGASQTTARSSPVAPSKRAKSLIGRAPGLCLI